MNDETKHRPENDRQKAALDCYYGLGYKRTYAAVAEKFNVSIRTVKYWSRIYAWRERIDQTDIGQIRTLKMSLDADVNNTNERLSKLARVAKAWTLKCLAGGKQSPTVRQLISLMKARLAAEELLDDKKDRQATSGGINVLHVDIDK